MNISKKVIYSRFYWSILWGMCLSFSSISTNAQTMNEVTNVVTKLFVATDQADWKMVKNCFAPKVHLDYSSMTGMPAGELSSEEIIQNWKGILPKFEHTHHQLGNFTSKIEGKSAQVFCYGTATHFLQNDKGNLWTVVGSYDFELLKNQVDKWIISSMKFNFKYQTGNSNLPQLAIKHLSPEDSTSESISVGEQNKNIVRQFFKALQEEDVNALVNLFAENAKHINPYHSGIFPEGATGKEEIRAYWTPVFSNFDGMKFPIEEIYYTENPNIVFVKYKGEIKLKNGIGYYQNDYYSTFKFNKAGLIEEYVEIFNPVVAARGFGLLEKLTQKKIDNPLKNKNMKKITFKSEGLTLVGNLYYPTNYEEGKSYPAIIVSGSWTTVKEQMAGLYAQKFAEKGFITLAFDFRNFGESEGEPRFYESPELKKTDIKNAVTFLENLPEISRTQIGAFGVCAGAMYTLMASAEEPRIKAIATTASWLHDAEAVKLFYGGEEGVNAKIEQAKSAKKKYAETGIIDYIPNISETDETAAMYGNYDYYLNPERGAIPQWSADKFAVMSWEDWLTTDPMPTAEKLTQPTLMIHSDGAVLPQYTKNYFDKISNPDKKLHWMKTDLDSPFHQFNYYDQEAEVQEAVQEASNWFTEKL